MSNDTEGVALDFERRARTVRSLGEQLRRVFYNLGGSYEHGKNGTLINSRYEVHRLEDDDNGTPGGTTGFDGQAVAFLVYEGTGTSRREYRIVVEDITMDDEILGR